MLYFLLGISVLVIIIHFIYFKYTFPGITVDEASFFSPAYNIAKNGNLVTSVHSSSLPAGSQFTYWMPPLYMVLLGIFLKISGPTVLNAKLFSFIITLLCCLPISGLVKDKFHKILLCSLFLIIPFVIISSSFIRMESLSTLLSVVLLYSVYRNSHSYILGILCGLMIMCHPMLMGNVIACSLFVLTRSWKDLFYFVVALLLSISPYLYYIFQDLEMFISQMQLQIQRKFSHGYFGDLIYVAQVLPVVLFSYLVFIKSRIGKDLRLFLLSGFSISFILFLKSGEFNYHIYLVPYFIMAFALMLENNVFAKLQVVISLSSFAFFTLLLVQKYQKNYYKSDKTYYEITTMLELNPVWKGSSIFVDGLFDVSKYLISKGEKVERFNAVARRNDNNWVDSYNCIIAVKEVKKPSKLFVVENLRNYDLKFQKLTSDSLAEVLIYQRRP